MLSGVASVVSWAPSCAAKQIKVAGADVVVVEDYFYVERKFSRVQFATGQID